MTKSPVEQLHDILRDLEQLSDLYTILETSDPNLYRPQVRFTLDDNLSKLREVINHSPPLKLLLLGGTGVGKSTFINAIAKAEVSAPSHSIRAHTSRFIIYAHERWKQMIDAGDLSASWGDELHSLSDFYYHQVHSLDALWLIDAPDIDSIAQEHHSRVSTALSQVDLPIWVTSPQKYRDLINVKMLGLIDQRRPTLAVINQMDTIDEGDRDILLLDAQEFIKEIGLIDVSWFMTSCAQQEVILYSKELVRFRAYLSQHLTQQVSERIRSLRLAQHFNEALDILSYPLEAQEQQRAFHDWITTVKQVFIPLTKRVIQRQYQASIRAQTLQTKDHISSSSNHNDQKRVWSNFFNAISDYGWWLIYELYQPSQQLEQSSLQSERLQLRAQELKLLRSQPNRQLDHSTSPAQSHIDRLVDETLNLPSFLALQQSPQVTKELKRLIPLSLLTWLLISLVLALFSTPSIWSIVVMISLSFLWVGRILYHRLEETRFMMHEIHQTAGDQLALKIVEDWLSLTLTSVNLTTLLTESKDSTTTQIVMKRYQQHLHSFRDRSYDIFETHQG
jgi:GTPase SAR1 family protein